MPCIICGSRKEIKEVRMRSRLVPICRECLAEIFRYLEEIGWVAEATEDYAEEWYEARREAYL